MSLHSSSYPLLTNSPALVPVVVVVVVGLVVVVVVVVYFIYSGNQNRQNA